MNDVKMINRHKLKNLSGRQFKVAVEEVLHGKAVYESAQGEIIDLREKDE